MSAALTIALTETRNAFDDMPASVDELDRLEGRLDELRDANVAHNLELVATAAEAGAGLVGLGELFTGPYFALTEHPVWRGLAEDALDGPTVHAVREAAARLGVVVVAPLYELDASSGRRFNTAVVVDADGALLGRFRKVHIPSGSNEVASFHEDFYYDPSDGTLGNGPADVSRNPHFPVFETAVGRVGVAICYDRHFEGSVRSLARNGAQLVLSPAVTFGEQSRRMWELEFAVDAARHGVFVAGSNRRGSEAPWDVEFFGGSHVAGPEGPVVARRLGAELVRFEFRIDAASLAARAGWDLAHDARPGTYSN